MAATLHVDASVATTGDGSLAAPFKTSAKPHGTAPPFWSPAAPADEPATRIFSQKLIGSYDGSFTTSNLVALRPSSTWRA
jgi:hypothetical protein